MLIKLSLAFGRKYTEEGFFLSQNGREQDIGSSTQNDSANAITVVLAFLNDLNVGFIDGDIRTIHKVTDDFCEDPVAFIA